VTAILTLLRPFLPYIIGAVLAFSAGWGGAWHVQGLRLTAAEQRHTQYVQEQTRIRQEAIDAANLQRDKANQAYELASQQLADSIAAGDVYRRCVAAGKCGVRKPASCPAPTVPPAIRPDEASADTVPSPREPATDETLAGECAVTTLMLNSLQRDIEAQRGY
jgi:hypothetical protein